MNLVNIANEAVIAANEAGDNWMAKASPKYVVTDDTGRNYGSLLDLCGNAHVQFRDKRSKIYKDCVKLDLVRKSGNGVFELEHKYRHRQEYGLMMACAEAAKKVLESHGITEVRIWSYVD